jgi:hypothetical protein
MRKKEIDAFVSFVKNDLNGDERGQAQTFCDRLFRAYGQKGIYEAQGKLEARIKIADTNTTNYIDCLWSPPNIRIMRVFTAAHQIMENNAFLYQKVLHIEQHQLETDEKIEHILTKMEDNSPKIMPEQIFQTGCVWDACIS